MGTLDDLPAVLDIRDDLRRALDESDEAIDDEVSGIYARLEDFTERDRASQERLLDEIDDELTGLRDRVSGEAAHRLEAAQNRIHTYRESLDRASENLVVLESTLRPGAEARDGSSPGSDGREDETGASLSDLVDETGAISATVVNEGEPREIMLAAEFYDADDETVDEVVGEGIRLGADEQRRIDVETRVPEDAEHYTVTVLDAGTQPEIDAE